MRKCGVTSSSHLTQCKRERKKEGETGRVINYLWYIYFPWNSDVEGYYIKDASPFRHLGMGEPWQTQVTQVPPTNLRITFNAISDCKPLVLRTFNLDNRSLYSLVVGTQKYFWVICTREVRQRRSLHNVGFFLQQILLRAPHGVIASFYYYRIQGLQHRSTVDLTTTMRCHVVTNMRTQPLKCLIHNTGSVFSSVRHVLKRSEMVLTRRNASRYALLTRSIIGYSVQGSASLTANDS